MATNSDTINRLIAQQFVDLVTHPDFVYADQIYMILRELFDQIDYVDFLYRTARRPMEEPEKVEPEDEPLRRGIQLRCFDDNQGKFSFDWIDRLRVRSGLVLLEISPDVKREEALLRLKSIVAFLEEVQVEWPPAEMLDDIETWEPEDDSPIPF
jgi:hypothetical protein